MKLKHLFGLYLLMRFRKFFILLAAAGAGMITHEIRHPGQQFGGDGDSNAYDAYYAGEQGTAAIDDRGAYSSLTGEGSLYQTLQSARDDARSGREYKGRDYGGNLVGQSGGASPQFSGGIGKVGGTGGTDTYGYSSSSSASSYRPTDDLALLQAAAKGDKLNVQRRIAAGAKVDSRDAERRTPLMYAAANGFEDIIDRLIAAGAHPNFKDRNGNNAYDYAAGRGLVETVQYLLKRTRSVDDRHYIEYAQTIRAVYAGDPSLLPPGDGKLASVNRLTPDGQAPLHIAAGNGSTALIAALVKRGAEVNLANDNGQTPLHWAAWNNQPTSAEALLNEGACVYQMEAAGNTPLMLAAQSNSVDVARILLSNGAEKGAVNKMGKTAAMQAEDRGFRPLSALLK